MADDRAHVSIVAESQRVPLILHVGGTQMIVDMADHYRPIRGLNPVVCKHCGVLVADFEQHLVSHVQRGELEVGS